MIDVDRSRIADRSQAPAGDRGIDWARRHSPVLDGFVRAHVADGALSGRRVAVVAELGSTIALLATVLAEAGAAVVVAGANPLTTGDEAAAALVERGIEVHGARHSSIGVWERDLMAVADARPQLIIDTGAEMTVRLESVRPDIYREVAGVAEATQAGADHLRALERDRRLPMPAVAACRPHADAGAGQATVQAILRLTNLRMPGKRVAILGYGPVGRGIATYVRAMGGRVIGVDSDPIKALAAHTDGHEVADTLTAVSGADIVVTSDGPEPIGPTHLDVLPESVVLANVGPGGHGIDLSALHRAAGTVDEVRPDVTRFTLGDRSVYLLAAGAPVVARPIETLDLSSSRLALGCHHLAESDLSPGVHDLPLWLERAVAGAKLADLGLGLASPPKGSDG